eukprot:2539784-Rhodomonas_salina.4
MDGPCPSSTGTRRVDSARHCSADGAVQCSAGLRRRKVGRRVRKVTSVMKTWSPAEPCGALRCPVLT